METNKLHFLVQHQEHTWNICGKIIVHKCYRFMRIFLNTESFWTTQNNEYINNRNRVNRSNKNKLRVKKVKIERINSNYQYCESIYWYQRIKSVF